MDEKMFRSIKARAAYREYIAQLPRCDVCKKCMFVSDRKNEKRVCMQMREIVDNRVQTCPIWCPLREENR